MTTTALRSPQPGTLLAFEKDALCRSVSLDTQGRLLLSVRDLDRIVGLELVEFDGTVIRIVEIKAGSATKWRPRFFCLFGIQSIDVLCEPLGKLSLTEIKARVVLVLWHHRQLIRGRERPFLPISRFCRDIRHSQNITQIAVSLDELDEFMV
jgi:hypothetical protein